MNTPTVAHTPSNPRASALLSLSAALLLAFAPLLAVRAEVDRRPALDPLADKAAKLPLDPSFAKETSGDNKGLYTLTLKNTSARAVKVSAIVDLSVVSHNRDKARILPPQVIDAGKTWKIDGLAAHDKVTLTAEGFEPLLLTVP